MSSKIGPTSRICHTTELRGQARKVPPASGPVDFHFSPCHAQKHKITRHNLNVRALQDPASLPQKLESKTENLRVIVFVLCTIQDLKRVVGLLSAGLAVAFVRNASAVGLPSLDQFSEPANALSLPTWAIHVSGVVEWYWWFFRLH